MTDKLSNFETKKKLRKLEEVFFLSNKVKLNVSWKKLGFDLNFNLFS